MIYKRAIFKFNNGNGALLCNRCGVIIETGNKDHEDIERYCGECKTIWRGLEPDIVMCPALDCSVMKLCKRNPASGARAKDDALWSGFEPDRGSFCAGFLPLDSYQIGPWE
jgi:hypothetical protein